MLVFIEYFDLCNIMFVCQDWGGVLGLILLMEMLDCFKWLVIMNIGLMVGFVDSLVFEEWKVDIVINDDVLVEFVMQKYELVILDVEVIVYVVFFFDQIYKVGVCMFFKFIVKIVDVLGVEIL